VNLYLVSKKSQDESSTGVLEVAETKVYGIYTTAERANVIADKYDASVTSFVSDQEVEAIVTRWTNPGYAS